VKNAAGKKASLAQAHDDGLIDPDFKPHAILPDPIHNDRMQKIPAVAAPWETDNHMSESVWRSSVEGGDPNPSKIREVINKPPMFNYPTHSDAPTAPHALPVEDLPAIAVDKATVDASKALRAKEAAAEKPKALAQHPVLADPLHEARKLKIQSVAGPTVTDGHIGASVHNSAMEGGEPIPEPRRDLIKNGFNPSFDAAT